jgi:hypothetical protein
MNNKLIFPGGETNMKEEDFMRLPYALKDFIDGMLGDWYNCVITGCAISAVPGITDPLVLTSGGYVYLDGEILQVDAGSYPSTDATSALWEYQKVINYNTDGDKTYQNGIFRRTWEEARAVPVNVSALTPGNINAVTPLFWLKNNDWYEFAPSDITGSDWTNAYTYPDDRNLKFRLSPCNQYGEFYGKIKNVNAITGAVGGVVITLPNFDNFYSRWYDTSQGLFLQYSQINDYNTLRNMYMSIGGSYGYIRNGSQIANAGSIHLINCRVPLKSPY